jgi:cytochrome P450
LKRYMQRVQPYVDAADRESLVSLFPDAPATEATKPAHQVTHWLFALGDTLAINAARCLALLATHDEARSRGVGADASAWLDACLQEAMRLWPTTPMLSRQAVRDSDWNGVRVPAGTQVLIVNTFNHRDRDDLGDRADSFEPEQWVTGDARDDWQFNHFSHGPQGCPGVALALLVGRTMLATLLRERDVQLLAPSLDPAKPLPHSLDYFSLRFSFSN